MAVITNSYANVASSFSAKFQRNIEGTAGPRRYPTHVIVAGFVGGGGVTRGLCVSSGDGDFIFVPFGCIHGCCRANADSDRDSVLLAGLLNTPCENADDISLIQPLCANPLTYLGGYFTR